MFYSIVLLDGKELHCLSLEDVQELFFKRRINQDSLACNAEDGQWMMLKRIFDLGQWIPPATAAPQNHFEQTSHQNSFEPAQNPFEQTAQTGFQSHAAPQNQYHSAPAQENEANNFVTFNQFPQNGAAQPKNPFAPENASNGYSQNNQTETYYQAETTPTNYNFQNNQTNYAPSKYSNPASRHNYANHSANPAGGRRGLRQAAIFLFINAFFYVGFIIFGAIFPGASGEGGSAAYKTGGVAGSVIPLIVDLILAVKLWKLDDTESARKWVLGRSYFGFAVFGVIVPLISFGTGNVFIGIFSFISTIFYFLSLAVVLHGKDSPSTGRLILGGASFAIYSVVMFGTIALATLGMLAPKLAEMSNLKNAQIEQYKIEGKEFQDKTTGAKVVLPEGWTMLALDNPLIHTPEARMIAVDKTANRLTMLEVVPVPGALDMKRQNSTWILDQLSDSVIKSVREEVKRTSVFSESTLNEVTRLNIYIGSHPAKLLVLDKIENGEKAKGHVIITYDELTFYVLHSWCPAAEYQTAQADFTFFEKNFTVPEKINSIFTQTADSQKK